MSKKILTGIIIILVILLVLLGVWFLFFREQTTETNTTTNGGSDTFFPINTTFDPETNTQTDQGDNEGEFDNVFIPKLRQISSVPTAGYVSFERQATSSESFVSEEGQEEQQTFTQTVFRYIERATGHLFETTENSLSQERLSNVTIPRIQEALFREDGNGVVLRYLVQGSKDIETFVSTLETNIATSTDGTPVEESKLEGYFLGNEAISVNISENNVEYLVKNNNGSTIFSNSFNNSNNTSTVINSNLSEWVFEKINNNTISLTTKADSRIPGFMFFVNTNTGAQTKVLGDIFGLTTKTSPSGKYVLYSEYRGGDYDTFVLNTETNEATRLSFQTYPEKCVWSIKDEETIYCGAPSPFPRAPHPESWYQGIISFSDVVWKTNLETRESRIILVPEDEDKSFDITNVSLSPNEEYLMFINKKDLTLWSLDIVE